MSGFSNINYVGFRLTDDEEHLKTSHANINTYELFATDGKPVHGGVYDLRLGTTDHSFACLTCFNGKKTCPGHRGHLTLRASVLQPTAISEIRRWLKVVCIKCGDLIVDEKYTTLSSGRRLVEAATSVTEGKKCLRCKSTQPKIVKDDEDYFTFWAEWNNDSENVKKIKLYPDIIRSIFEKITDETVILMGKNIDTHPSKLVLRTISVPPNTIRPGVKSYGGAGNSYHDSTNVLQHIVKRNEQLPIKLPDNMTSLPEHDEIVDGEIDRSVQNLQQLYYDLIMGSASTSVTQGSTGKRGLVVGTRPVHSFLRNLPRKEGRIRFNLLGKRVFYISRSTISGNMKFRIDDVGIPLEFARTLQVEEVVQEYNKTWLMTFFLNGRKQYPGCTYVFRRSTREIHDVAGIKDFHLEIGDVLYRDVINGDLAFFNRQPTLERSSIGVHKVIVIQDPSVHTFQMNVLACEGYNADFDGDQMNLWVARGASARAEAIILSSISNWFISTKTSSPVNGEVQDSVIGCYGLTKSSVMIDRYHAMSLFTNVEIKFPKFKKNIYTGREIISLLLAGTPINITKVPTSYNDVYAPYIKYDKDETLTVIERGQMLRGILDKRTIGAKSSSSIFYLISRDYGSKKALEMIYALQQIVLQFLMIQGFTVGTADLLAKPEVLEQIHKLTSSVLLESQVITQRLLNREIVPPIGSTIHEFYEQLQRAALKVNESEILRLILGSIRFETNGFFRIYS